MVRPLQISSSKYVNQTTKSIKSSGRWECRFRYYGRQKTSGPGYKSLPDLIKKVSDGLFFLRTSIFSHIDGAKIK
jgi:hypothetical protein